MKNKMFFINVFAAIVLCFTVDASLELIKSVQSPILNSSGRDIHVTFDSKGLPMVTQSYALDASLSLTYILKSSAIHNDTYVFPQDFLLEVPYVFMKQHPSKRLDQITVLGSHNCFANKAEGFLYYQQIVSSEDQLVRGGVRMLRPAWHNPSGSFIDKPNLEPILCHADDDRCATVSLATRGFRPHHVVRELNQTVEDILNKDQDQFIIVGINNFLSDDKTDQEIEKIIGLKDMVITQNDLDNIDNQKEWHGAWPTIAWMKKHNKRALFFNDYGSTQYTVDYKKNVLMNQYGTNDITKAAQLRNITRLAKPEALVELSWFQDISLNPADQRALDAGIDFYQNMKQQLAMYRAGGSWLLNYGAYVLKTVGFPTRFFEENMNFRHIVEAMNFIHGKFKIVGSDGPFKYIFSKIAGYQASFKQAMNDIMYYVPVKQDNSCKALFDLFQACYKSGTLLSHQYPNIIMLDFSTTEGDGLLVVNILNILMDQRLQLQFLDIGGFAVSGQEVIIPAEMLSSNKQNTFVW